MELMREWFLKVLLYHNGNYNGIILIFFYYLWKIYYNKVSGGIKSCNINHFIVSFYVQRRSIF